ncbi:MAG: arylsulfatase [Marinilabiliaceae bacterium]|jgi:arylsulfatase|nr:arylsulfatase [Marinilabiliaceae bacterium]
MTLKHSFFLLLIISVLTFSCTSTTDTKPNIIYILADDLGYGELGAYGQTKIETPNIDRLAENGMVFTQHYSGSPVCAPSRCVLLTGLHSGHSYVRGNDEWAERGPVWDYVEMIKNPALEGQRPLPEGTTTIGTLLQSAGYKTAIVGKWGLGAPGTEGVPNKQGFDLFFGYNCQRQAHTYNPVHLWKNEERVFTGNDTIAPGTKLNPGADPYNPESYKKFWQAKYSPDLMFDEIKGFVNENKDNPFFLYWATPIPHAAIQAPPEWVNKYVEKFGDEEPYTGDQGYFPNRYPHAAYAGMVSYLDDQVGQLVEQLKDLGIYENTLIIFTSDNGHTYNGGTDSEWFNSAGLFNEGYGWTKGFVHEGGIRVPMIVHWPGKVIEASSSDHISAFWDVMPTLCDVAGIEAPEGIDGISFLPEISGKGTQEKHEFLYWEFPSYQGQQAVRMGEWKAIRKDIFKGNMQLELYNLETDPLEENDVAADNPEIVKQIEEILKQSRVQPEIERFRIKELGDEKPGGE